MKIKTIILLLCLFTGITSFAQQKEKMTREDKQEKNEARDARINKKNDYALFRKAMMGLPEYAKEKKKIPAIQKNNKGPVKLVATIDSNDNDDDATSKTLVGYITQVVGDNTTNMYEVTFDREKKKIVAIKRTPEAADAEKDENEDKDEEISEKKTPGKKLAPKKTKDDDDDPDEEKPSKTKKKEKDDDD